MNGLTKLAGSYKGVTFIICVALVGGLVAMGKVTYEQFVDFVKWGFGSLVVARAGEEGLKGFNSVT